MNIKEAGATWFVEVTNGKKMERNHMKKIGGKNLRKKIISKGF